MTEDPDNRRIPVRRRKLRESRNLFVRLSSSYSASRRQGQRILKRAGNLSIVEWRTVWDLSEAGPMTISELADIQRTDHSLLSRALPIMRRKGLVQMQRDKKDGRQTIVSLTETGRAAYEQAAPYMKARREALRAQFTAEELDDFVSYIDRLEVFLLSPIDEWMKDFDVEASVASEQTTQKREEA